MHPTLCCQHLVAHSVMLFYSFLPPKLTHSVKERTLQSVPQSPPQLSCPYCSFIQSLVRQMHPSSLLLTGLPSLDPTSSMSLELSSLPSGTIHSSTPVIHSEREVPH